MTASEKTLAEYINGRIIDKIYVPRDIQAKYDLNKLKADISIPASKTEEKKLSSRLDALKAQIKASSDCLTLRSLKSKELGEMAKHYEEWKTQAKKDSPDVDVEIPFKEQWNTQMFLRSIVSVTDKDGKVTNAQDKTIDEWLDYFEEIQDSQFSSYKRIAEKMDSLRVTSEQEQAIIEDLDFLD